MDGDYPAQSAVRDRWILARRGPRRPLDPLRPWSFLLEEERSASGDMASVATVFLTNRECPWRCLMCDLWQNTLTESVPPGAIPAQVDFALRHLEAEAVARPASLRHLKLYNSGSFFDPRAIPPEDHPAIAEQARGFGRVIVECHPALADERCVRFRDRLSGQLEVALGLETAHPQVLEKLNKRMTPDDFAGAAALLRKNDIAVRAFVLIQPPFLDEAAARHWARRSMDFAFDCGAEVVSLIPTRAGNGAMDALAAAGLFSAPRLATVEDSLEYGLQLRRGRVFVDLWNLENLARCRRCFAPRSARLRQMNLTQQVLPAAVCPDCHGAS